jgi:hypothetical protein
MAGKVWQHSIVVYMAVGNSVNTMMEHAFCSRSVCSSIGTMQVYMVVVYMKEHSSVHSMA